MAANLPLTDDCWQNVFRFINDSDHHRHLEPLSLISKHFLSITNRLRLSLTIYDPTLPFLPHLFYRFPNLTSLDLTRLGPCDLDALLLQLSLSPLHLTSLNLSNHPNIPADGLLSLAKKAKTLTSLVCSNIGSLSNTDLFVIADCFPFLEELDLSFPKEIDCKNPIDAGLVALSFALTKLRKVNVSGIFYKEDSSLLHMCKNCELLEEVVMCDYQFITRNGVSVIRERPSLRSLFVRHNKSWGTRNQNHFGDFARRGNVCSQFISSLVSLHGLTCLDLSFLFISDELLSTIAEKGIPLRRLGLSYCIGYSYVGIFCLLSKCQFFQHLNLQKAEFLNDQHVAELSVFLGDLVSINLSDCKMLTNLALFTLIKKCSLLSEIRMERTGIGKRGVEEDYISLIDSSSSIVNPQVKSIHLACNSWSLKDEIIKMFASICPNLQVLDLSSCYDTVECIEEVLSRCCKIRDSSLAIRPAPGVRLHGMNFELPKLEVLNLSQSKIDDEVLCVISESCCGLLHLDLHDCSHVTAVGVRLVVENCTQLREINLQFCYKVEDADVVAWMVFSRPSLRKITAPPSFRSSESMRKLLLHHGCLVC